MDLFPVSNYYFIDMELCDINLHDFLHPKTSPMQSRLARFASVPSRSGPIGMWDIMVQLTSGLKFIHDNGEVHSDLKPTNGELPGSEKLIYTSLVFTESIEMEVNRLRISPINFEYPGQRHQ
jgi:serine/threonine protein kinase